MDIKISPSMLASDYANLERELKKTAEEKTLIQKMLKVK